MARRAEIDAEMQRVVAGERAEARRGGHARAEPELEPQELVLARALRPARARRRARRSRRAPRIF